MASLRSVSTESKPTARRAPRTVLRPAAELQLRLLSRLSTTLSIVDQINIFHQEINTDLKVDSLHYLPEDDSNTVDIGDDASHKTEYRLNLHGESLGSIRMTRKRRFREDELGWFEQALSHLVFPLKNARQYQNAIAQAMIDPLTGTGNRRALEQALEREFQSAHRHGHILSTLVIDLDHFKKVNDTLGHGAGDHVLKTVARTLASLVRGTDQLFRFGGEEFVVLLPQTDVPGARIVAERLRTSIDGMILTHDAKSITPTISIGMSTIRRGDSSEALLKRADAALYRAKDKGRNRVCTDVGI